MVVGRKNRWGRKSRANRVHVSSTRYIATNPLPASFKLLGIYRDGLDIYIYIEWSPIVLHYRRVIGARRHGYLAIGWDPRVPRVTLIFRPGFALDSTCTAACTNVYRRLIDCGCRVVGRESIRARGPPTTVEDSCGRKEFTPEEYYRLIRK